MYWLTSIENMKRLLLILTFKVLLAIHSETFCFFSLCVLIIMPSWYLHGTLGLIIAIIVTPFANKFFYPRVMLNEDGSFKDKKKIEEELERLRKL